MRHLKQTTKDNCGQTCVAMLVGLSPGEVEEFFNQPDGRTTDRVLDKALKNFRLRLGVGYRVGFGDFAIQLDKQYVLLTGRGTGHWVVVSLGEVFDPHEDSMTPMGRYDFIEGSIAHEVLIEQQYGV